MQEKEELVKTSAVRAAMCRPISNRMKYVVEIDGDNDNCDDVIEVLTMMVMMTASLIGDCIDYDEMLMEFAEYVDDWLSH